MSLRMPLSCCLVFLATVFLWSAGARAEPDAFTRYTTAVITRDTDTLQKILADNYLHINANGYLQDKEHFIANLKNGAMIVDRLTIFDSIETKYGDTLVITGNVLFRGKFTPKLHEGLQRVTAVAEGEGKQERILLFQATPVIDRKERHDAEKKAPDKDIEKEKKDKEKKEKKDKK